MLVNVFIGTIDDCAYEEGSIILQLIRPYRVIHPWPQLPSGRGGRKQLHKQVGTCSDQHHSLTLDIHDILCTEGPVPKPRRNVSASASDGLEVTTQPPKAVQFSFLRRYRQRRSLRQARSTKVRRYLRGWKLRSTFLATD